MSLISQRLAKQHPLLTYAILTCSAHILRLLSPHRDDLQREEDHNQHKCVQLLIPLLDNLALAVGDEVVLATIVILRMSEQYDEYHIDRQYHLVPGAFSHFNANGPSSTSMGGLHEATFYSYVRSDIRMAILGHCGTRISLDAWPLDTRYPSNDADWANRMTWLLVQSMNLCYGGKDTRGLLPRHQLERFIEEWKGNLPETFEPYYFRDTEWDDFPIIRLLTPWHGKKYSRSWRIYAKDQQY